MTNKNKIHSLKGLEIIKILSNEGKRIFHIADAQEVCSENLPAIRKYLHYLTQEGWLSRVKPGVYAIQMPGSQPLHEFEVAMALVQPAAISHWSAMSYYNLTDQISRQVYITTTHGGGFPVFGLIYQIMKTNPSRFFGHIKIWINDQKILITDKERTLIDGLLSPQYCGGFDEVISGFQRASGQIDIKKIIEYAFKLDRVIPRRLGWILEHLQIGGDYSKLLESVPMSSVGSLNPSGLRKGQINMRWNLIENLHEKVT
jgi:predicted transcriptional regulator of viral defense system